MKLTDLSYRIKIPLAISAVIFVVSGKWNLITIAILGSVENSDLAQAAAGGLLRVNISRSSELAARN